ncbi:MAG: aminopeptidase [Burkholderiales bacterium]|nr:aminopeptidase [Burkholderiales bacterium]
MRRRPRWSGWPRIMIACAALALAGCGAMEAADYYWQGASGQMDILARAKPIGEVIDASPDPALRQRLARVQHIRAFASHDLGLPDNASYTSYADLERRYVVWNVFAAPEFSLTPREWCFPIAGCVSYRGYFSEVAARDEAARLAAQGDDVWVGGVPAYSTLGYFDDPVLSTFVRWPESEVARMVFHELAHQVVYVKDDTQFNESFAAAVEEVGVRRWLDAQGDAQQAAHHARAQRLRDRFRVLVADARERLAAAYASDAPDPVKRERKAAAFAAMRAGYDEAKVGLPGLAGYERWFAGDDGRGPNNASMVSVALYVGEVPAFRAMLAEEGGDLPRFYARVKALAALPKSERDAALARAADGGERLAPPSATTARTR